MDSKYFQNKHACCTPFEPNTSEFDVIITTFEPPYKYVTVNGETRKYLI